LEKDCERTTLIVRSACAASRRSGSRLTNGVRCASAFARLVLPQVGEAEKESHRHLARDALPGALKDVDRLVEGTERLLEQNGRLPIPPLPGCMTPSVCDVAPPERMRIPSCDGMDQA